MRGVVGALAAPSCLQRLGSSVAVKNAQGMVERLALPREASLPPPAVHATGFPQRDDNRGTRYHTAVIPPCQGGRVLHGAHGSGR